MMKKKIAILFTAATTTATAAFATGVMADPGMGGLVWAAFPVTGLLTMGIGIVLLRRLWSRRVGIGHMQPAAA